AENCGPKGPCWDSVRAPDRHPLGVPAAGDGVWVRHDVLASPARLATRGRVAEAPPGVAPPPGRCGPHRLVAGCAGLCERARKKGGKRTGPNPTDKGKPGSKRHVVVDAQGIPLAAPLSAGNAHGSMLFEALLAATERLTRPWVLYTLSPNLSKFCRVLGHLEPTLWPSAHGTRAGGQRRMLRMLDRHAVRALRDAGRSSKEIAAQFGVSQRTVQRILKEPPVASASDAEERRRRGVGRPGVPERVRLRLAALVTEDPEAPPLELLRQLREEGVKLGESTFYRLYRRAVSALPASLMVRFEGVAGEFAQFDFGEVDVRLLDGRKRRVHFAAYRLKYSRWIHVAVVRDERLESLVRALLMAVEAGGGAAVAGVFSRAEQAGPLCRLPAHVLALDPCRGRAGRTHRVAGAGAAHGLRGERRGAALGGLRPGEDGGGGQGRRAGDLECDAGAGGHRLWLCDRAVRGPKPGAEGLGRESGRLRQAQLLSRPPLRGSGERSAAPAQGVAGERERGAAEPGDR